jgi:hypothetical protein
MLEVRIRKLRFQLKFGRSYSHIFIIMIISDFSEKVNMEVRGEMLDVRGQR